MPNHSTYSFKDIHAVFASPGGFGSATTDGNGVGSIRLAYTRDNTVHDAAADGSIMVSKVCANEGTITVTCQQSSQLHNYFRTLFNNLYAAPTEQWAGMTFTISSPGGVQDYHIATGVSFKKRADQPYEQTGQEVTWEFMAAEITSPAGGAVQALI